jgi:phosphoribosylformylglycinamidine cyclo-ligase
VLPKGLGARIDLTHVPVSPVFQWLASEGAIAQDEMLRTFNCGVGMIVVTSPKDSQPVSQAFSRAGEKVVALGNVIKASSDMRVVYDGKLNLG